MSTPSSDNQKSQQIDESDDIRTFIVCAPDAVGRLMGKSVDLRQWQSAVEEGMPMPDFHLATDLTNTIQSGLAITGPHTGHPNGLLVPDLATLRRLPWSPGVALVLSDVLSADRAVIEQAPRQVLRRQVERLSAHGLNASVATELEFYLFGETYARANEMHHRELTPAVHQQGDHDVLVEARYAHFLSPLRERMEALGYPVISTLAEGGIGQLEVNFGHGAPMDTADGQVLFKFAAKALAADLGLAVTFMAKWHDDQPGSSGHIHLSLTRVGSDVPVFDNAADPDRLSDDARAFLAGIVVHSADFALLHAPYVNSYRRLRAGSWVPQSNTWNVDDRGMFVRLLGRGQAGRLEFRYPGSDMNPYLSLAALIAAGLEGLEGGNALPERGARPSAALLPVDLRDAVERFGQSEVARRALGEAVHEHYERRGQHELHQSEARVADWERTRGFERA